MGEISNAMNASQYIPRTRSRVPNARNRSAFCRVIGSQGLRPVFAPNWPYVLEAGRKPYAERTREKPERVHGVK